MRTADAADAIQDLLYFYIFYFPNFAFITFMPSSSDTPEKVIQ